MGPVPTFQNTSLESRGKFPSYQASHSRVFIRHSFSGILRALAKCVCILVALFCVRREVFI